MTVKRYSLSALENRCIAVTMEICIRESALLESRSRCQLSCPTFPFSQSRSKRTLCERQNTLQLPNGPILSHWRLLILPPFSTLETVLLNRRISHLYAWPCRSARPRTSHFLSLWFSFTDIWSGTLNEGSPRRKGGQLVSPAASYQGLSLVRPAILKGFSWISPVTPGKCRGSTLTQTVTA
jgi:hypothetical protein